MNYCTHIAIRLPEEIGRIRDDCRKAGKIVYRTTRIDLITTGGSGV